MSLSELYFERRKLIKERRSVAEQIDALTPPDNSRWTSNEKNNKLLSLSIQHMELVMELDKNKLLIQQAKKLK